MRGAHSFGLRLGHHDVLAQVDEWHEKLEEGEAGGGLLRPETGVGWGGGLSGVGGWVGAAQNRGRPQGPCPEGRVRRVRGGGRGRRPHLGAGVGNGLDADVGEDVAVGLRRRADLVGGGAVGGAAVEGGEAEGVDLLGAALAVQRLRAGRAGALRLGAPGGAAGGGGGARPAPRQAAGGSSAGSLCGVGARSTRRAAWPPPQLTCRCRQARSRAGR
jgi:hypothetical protein